MKIYEFSLIMGVETPIPPVVMDAAARGGAQVKNSDEFFSSSWF
jgi:hypothetical protein